MLVAGTLVFSIISVIIKAMTVHHSVFTISFFRNLFSFLPAAAWMVYFKPAALRMRPAHWQVYAARAVTGFLSMILLYKGYRLQTLADATVLYFCGPILICVLAAMIMRERLDIARIIAVVAGLAGVIVMVKPGSPGFGVGAAYTMAGTVCYAASILLIRSLGKSESPFVMSFYFSLLTTLLSLMFLPFHFQGLTMADIVLLSLVGILAFIGQTLTNAAYKLADASFLAPFIYTTLLWNTAFGYMAWGDLPTQQTIFGTLLIIGGNVLVYFGDIKSRLGKTINAKA